MSNRRCPRPLLPNRGFGARRLPAKKNPERRIIFSLRAESQFYFALTGSHCCPLSFDTKRPNQDRMASHFNSATLDEFCDLSYGISLAFHTILDRPRKRALAPGPSRPPSLATARSGHNREFELKLIETVPHPSPGSPVVPTGQCKLQGKARYGRDKRRRLKRRQVKL